MKKLSSSFHPLKLYRFCLAASSFSRFSYCMNFWKTFFNVLSCYSYRRVLCCIHKSWSAFIFFFTWHLWFAIFANFQTVLLLLPTSWVQFLENEQSLSSQVCSRCCFKYKKAKGWKKWFIFLSHQAIKWASTSFVQPIKEINFAREYNVPIQWHLKLDSFYEWNLIIFVSFNCTKLDFVLLSSCS